MVAESPYYPEWATIVCQGKFGTVLKLAGISSVLAIIPLL